MVISRAEVSRRKGKETRLMMSQREHGLEPAGEGVGRSGPAEACAVRRAGEAAREGGRRRSSASGSTAKRFRRVPSMFDSLGVQVPCTT